MNAQNRRLALALALGLLALAGALTTLGTWSNGPAAAQAQNNPTRHVASAANDHHVYLPLVCQGSGPVRHVAPAGIDSGDCTDPNHPCGTVQYAVDQAVEGDEIRVATGVYTDVHQRAGITQTVYISKTVIVRGGYLADFCGPPDPPAHPTTLDAQGQGRVLYIAGSISPTVEGLRITGGDATALGGGMWPYYGDAGGGVYVLSATPTMRHNQVFSNTAQQHGGGLYLKGSAAILHGNTITANVAGEGGGLCLENSPATLTGNTVAANGAGNGGGLHLLFSPATISNNTISANSASSGGGLYLIASNATLNGNTVSTNTAGYAGGGLYLHSSPAMLGGNTIRANSAPSGGGLYLLDCAATLNGNTLISNTATSGGGLYLSDSASLISDNTITANTVDDQGGGLFLDWSAATLTGNTVTANSASRGGGLSSYYSPAVLQGNAIRSNSADHGGGLFLDFDSDATLTNNVIADNQAHATGSGLYILDSAPRLRHTTIAHNHGGDGSGIHITNNTPRYKTVVLDNTILVSHTVGLTITAGNAATLAGTLWGSGSWANQANWGGAGSVTTGTVNVQGDPGFVDPASGNYHIAPESAAVDAGIASEVLTDMDGDPRPAAFGFDIGADERPGASLRLHLAAQPLDLNPGRIVTYTLVITSVGSLAATDVWFTDTLPTLQQAMAITTTQGSCAADTDWGGRATCFLGTMTPGDRVRITLTARATTTLPAQMPWRMHNTAQVAAAEASNIVHVDIMLQDCHVRLNDGPIEYGSIQAAVDASTQSSDVVKVAGCCTGATPRGDTTQLVYLDKTLTLQGGWNRSFTQRDPATYPTTLDAWGQGRVLYIYTVKGITATVEGLCITGGDATGLGGNFWMKDEDAGGGVYVLNASVIFRNNQVFGNIAEDGGGLSLFNSVATLSGNTITANTAEHDGGGVYTGSALTPHQRLVTLRGNTVSANTAKYSGGGLCLEYSAIVLGDNLITDNSASSGGGLCLQAGAVGSAVISGNTVTANTANRGGGLFVRAISSVTLTNNVVADNQAHIGGSGLFIYSAHSLYMLHTTVARNGGGDGSGVYITDYRYEPYSTVWLTNTILVSHTTGISITGGSSVAVNGILWHDTPITVSQAPTATVAMQNQHWGDPGFVDPAAGDYHIGPTSAAINAGVDAGVTTDMDGDARPDWCFFDLGADEFITGMECKRFYLPLVLRDTSTQ